MNLSPKRVSLLVAALSASFLGKTAAAFPDTSGGDRVLCDVKAKSPEAGALQAWADAKGKAEQMAAWVTQAEGGFKAKAMSLSSQDVIDGKLSPADYAAEITAAFARVGEGPEVKQSRAAYAAAQAAFAPADKAFAAAFPALRARAASSGHAGADFFPYSASTSKAYTDVGLSEGKDFELADCHEAYSRFGR